MRLYVEVARRSFQRVAAYRAAMLAGLLTNAFFGAVRSFVYIAIYQSGGEVAGFGLRDAITYTWVTQMMISIGSGWVSWDIMTSIRSGEVITDLSRPWNFYGYWLSRTLGAQCFGLGVRGALTYLLGVLYFGAAVPTPGQLLAFALAIGLAMLVSFAYSFLVNISAFWLLDSTGLVIIANIMLSFFSGMLLPIGFFPEPLAALARVLPFQAITGLPAEVFLGKIGGADLLPTLLLQLLWVVVMTGLALLALQAAMRKVVIQGG
ncbi:MAG: ABC-2 family transporter protein [Roseiflexaceae bacterium]